MKRAFATLIALAIVMLGMFGCASLRNKVEAVRQVVMIGQ